ncbi:MULTISPECIES: N-formylglutamate amidohydrolase [Acetobacteraceae]|uniref:N-formylglutamate deformylase n=2 Tax=Acetobacteraceae TaxID=433 RepID=A0ABX4ZLV5_9PROT|nr:MULTISPECIES: N-formylglutamate amidohydrolase [Acetobacteraceae]MUG79363.1 N-formylglutamate deformylase [Bombella sp. ESL0380]MUH02670.1 N-formylglutamate deformylase [Bombella sp. ESL0387]POS62869.1 N-formylglutamate deformylase [Parasaccharibacter apium]QGT75029.1 N-formylglutamate deformylase [Bombella sp. ESL0368]MBE1723234.1 N-formylglutamate amidohydrolase [Bombella apis]
MVFTSAYGLWQAFIVKKNQKLPCTNTARPSSTVGIHLPSCRKRTPFLLSSPHSGRNYPQHFLEMAVLPMTELERMEDRFTDQLLQYAPENGLSLVQALFPRSFCDVNRDWRELDATMFSPPLIEKDLILSTKVSAGYGVIPRCTSPGKSIYRYCLPLEEAGHRLSQYWEPYHTALQQTQKTLHAQFGASILLDIHSMPPLAQSRPCDVVLGNRHGKTCSDRLISLVEHLFLEKGYHVQRNTPYSGGYITGRYGQMEENRQTLQVEINRACYLNLQTLQPNRHFEKVQKDITDILSEMARTHPAP